MKTKWIIILIIGWLLAGYTLKYLVAILDMQWNLFYYSPKWDLETLILFLGILVALTATWFLARATNDTVSQLVSALICLVLLGFAIIWFFTAPQSFFGKASHPLWFRSVILIFQCIPCIFWLWWRYKQSQIKMR